MCIIEEGKTKARPDRVALSFYPSMPLGDHGVFLGTEEQRNAPDARQGDHRVDNAGENGTLAAADPCNDVERKQSDAAPVQGTDNGENQGDFVDDHVLLPLSFFTGIPVCSLLCSCESVFIHFLLSIMDDFQIRLSSLIMPFFRYG